MSNRPSEATANRDIWNRVYADGSAFYEYPDENVVRLINGKQCSLDTTRPLRALDVGFGSGNNLLFLARKGFVVDGVEIVQAAVDHVRATAKVAGLQVCAGTYDPPRLPYDDGTFDLVLSWNCMHYMGSPHLVDEHLAECHRVLTPAGTLLASTISRRHALAASATARGDGTYEVLPAYRHDSRAGAILVVPQSEADFAARFRRFADVKTGYLSLSLFDGQFHECYIAKAIKGSR